MSYQKVYEALGATNYRWVTTAGGTKIRWSESSQKVVDAYFCGGTAAASTSSEPGFLDKIWGGFKDVARARAAGSGQPGMIIGGGGTPSWLMPVAIGGVALAAVLLLKKKKGAESK